MTEKEFSDKVKKKFPHAYSLVPFSMWTWIYRNFIV